MTDLRQAEYNKFDYLPNIPYKCIEYLLSNDDVVWKLLFYNDPNAWKSDADHPNLTTAQKGSLIYDGLKQETDCRVFLDYGQDESWQEQACILRVSVIEAVPTTYIWGYLSIGFEVYSHYKINQLSNYKTRTGMVTQKIIETFNGVDLGEGIGRVYFDYRRNPRSKMILLGSSPFKGAGIVLSNHEL